MQKKREGAKSKMRIDVYEVEETADFNKQLNRLIKKKCFLSLPFQIKELFTAFSKGEFEGDILKSSKEPIAYDVYKLRLPNPDTNVGKSNGYRVIYLILGKQKGYEAAETRHFVAF